MSSISRILSALWGVLCLVVIAVLMAIYANFPLLSQWHLPEQLGNLTLNKDQFFYLISGSFLVINLLYYITLKIGASGSHSTQGMEASGYAKVRQSLKVQAIGLNIFLIFFMIFLQMTGQNSSFEYQGLIGLFFVGPIIMMIGLIIMLYWLLKSQRFTS